MSLFVLIFNNGILGSFFSSFDDFLIGLFNGSRFFLFLNNLFLFLDFFLLLLNLLLGSWLGFLFLNLFNFLLDLLMTFKRLVSNSLLHL
mmetsp:Transcript_74195/g.103074  ORF Transcript_74195/g.103074 Transcript_74195/m.103074 type:complete len:89 (-) Transcript_74195:701-967(-)